MNRYVCAFFAFLLCTASVEAASPAPGVLPDPALTPGVSVDLPLHGSRSICDTLWGQDKRTVTDKMKNDVYAAYGIKPAHLPDGGSAYEIDHLVSRELGGADDEKNLWPQPYTGLWNAHEKDRVENRLHVEVCAGNITLKDAQHEISTDWRLPYKRYFGDPKP